jgi:DNA-binding CsgD family transcriptional regulator
MGRKKLPIDEMAILGMRSQGKSIKEISGALDVSTATLSRRIADLRHKEGILTKYRELQGLQLTDLQLRLLEASTPEKIVNASFLDLVRCYSILDRSIRKIEGKEPSFKITNLVEYLIEIERQEKEEAERNDD